MLQATYGEEKPKKDEVIEDKDLVVDEVEDTGEEEKEELNAVEQEAISKGWKPDGVPGKRNITAEEFLERESLYGRIHKQDKMIKRLESTMDEMAGQHKKIAKLEREKVLEELKAKKKDAFENSDFDAVIKIDEQIQEARDVQTDTVSYTPPDPNYVNPEFPAWKARNSWYDEEKNPDLYDEAETLGQIYLKRNPRATASDIYDYVEKNIKRLHPEKFESTPTRRSEVEGSQRASTTRRNTSRKASKKDLSAEQQRVMNRYVSRGVMTEEEYIDELIKIGEI